MENLKHQHVERYLLESDQQGSHKTIDQIVSSSSNIPERIFWNSLKTMNPEEMLCSFFQYMGLSEEESFHMLSVWKKAKHGCLQSMLSVAEFAYNSEYTELAYYWYYAASRSGSDEAKLIVGAMIMEGKGTSVDLESAKELFLLIIDSSKDEKIKGKAYNNLSAIYFKQGKTEKCKDCVKKGAKIGDPTCQRSLADLIFREGKRGYEVRSTRLWRKASEGGDGLAVFRLSLLEEDPEVILDMTRKSSDMGCWRATVCLAFKILTGKTVGGGLEEAFSLLKKAEDQIPSQHHILKQVRYLVFYISNFHITLPYPDIELDTGLEIKTVIASRSIPSYFPSLEDKACQERNNLNWSESYRLFQQASPTAHTFFNLGMMDLIGLGKDRDTVSAVYYLTLFLKFSQDMVMSLHVSSIIEDI